jgi:hypothetical protein
MSEVRQVGGPCVECGVGTVWMCSDCAIDSGGTARVYVCTNGTCQMRHENKHPHVPFTTYENW